VPHDISWDEYNAHQHGRAPRQLLLEALALRRPDVDEALADVPGGAHDVVPAPPVGAPVAVDLGCGEGIEVEVLLAAGWHVHAVDGEPAALARLVARVDPAVRDRLHVQHRAFGEVGDLPAADLVHSSYALPYCPPEDFDALWRRVRGALRPGGMLVVQLFGVRDGAAGTSGMTFHTLAQVQGLLAGLDLLHWREEDEPGTSFTGPKHWHVFHVVARRPAVG